MADSLMRSVLSFTFLNMADFLLFTEAFGSRIGQEGWDFKYDLVLDGRVDFRDFPDLVGKFNKPG